MVVKDNIVIKKYSNEPIGNDDPDIPINQFLDGRYKPNNLTLIAEGKRDYRGDSNRFRVYMDKNGVAVVHTCWWYNCHDFEFVGRVDDIRKAKVSIERNLEIKLEVEAKDNK